MDLFPYGTYLLDVYIRTLANSNVFRSIRPCVCLSVTLVDNFQSHTESQSESLGVFLGLTPT